jgi:hypothetical protein
VTGGDLAVTLPDKLSSCDELPDILFLNVDSFSKMMSDHKPIMLAWQKRSLIETIFIDEIHTLYGELYRCSNSSLCRISTMGCRIVTMSGTLPESFIQPLGRHLRISNMHEHVTKIISPQFLGEFPEGFHIECIESENPEKLAISRIHDIISNNLEQSGIHVIVSSKNMALTISQGMTDLYISHRCVTSDDSPETMFDIAKKWSMGYFEVLVSTTVALVGNENKDCGSVIIVGYLFDLMSVVQAISRLRHNQRKPNGMISLIFPKKNDDWFAAQVIRDDTKKKLLENRGLLDKTCIEFESVCTIEGIRDWIYSDVGCRMKSLSARFGYASNECKVCDRCNASPTQIMCVEAKKKEIEENKMLNSAITMLAKMERVCIVCVSEKCNGENCLGKNICYKCGSNRHLSSVCNFRVNDILQRRGCFFCFDLYIRQGYTNHDKSTCPLQRRLKRLLIEGFRKSKTSSFLEYVCKHLASEDSLYHFLGTFSTQK